MKRIHSLSREATAGDYTVAAIGVENAPLLLQALRADWMTPDEAARLAPLAAGVAFIVAADIPKHRGVAA